MLARMWPHIGGAPIFGYFWLRPAGGDPEIDRPQKYFFEGLCFFE